MGEARFLDALDGEREIERVEVLGGLGEIPGVGEAIDKKITELVTTGRLGFHERFKTKVSKEIHSD